MPWHPIRATSDSWLMAIVIWVHDHVAAHRAGTTLFLRCFACLAVQRSWHLQTNNNNTAERECGLNVWRQETHTLSHLSHKRGTAL